MLKTALPEDFVNVKRDKKPHQTSRFQNVNKKVNLAILRFDKSFELFVKRFRSTSRKMTKLQCKWEDLTKTTQIQVMTVEGCKPRPSIAAFDLDGTIITTKSGRVFATNPDDWKLLYEPQVVQTLKKLHEQDGYKIVFITNQAGIATGKTSVKDFRKKVEDIVNLLGIPLQLFCATEK